jgi:hypothetical protein
MPDTMVRLRRGLNVMVMRRVRGTCGRRDIMRGPEAAIAASALTRNDPYLLSKNDPVGLQLSLRVGDYLPDGSIRVGAANDPRRDR